MRDKLKQQGIDGTCDSLHKIPRKTLQGWFGQKTGELLYAFSRGQDSRPLKLPENSVRKSVGAEMNYAIRFKGEECVKTFMKSLCEEVASRLRAVGVLSKTLTLKLKRRRAGASEPAKFMGHGSCDNFSKSQSFSEPCDDPDMLCEFTFCPFFWRSPMFPCFYPFNSPFVYIQVNAHSVFFMI